MAVDKPGLNPDVELMRNRPQTDPVISFNLETLQEFLDSQ